MMNSDKLAIAQAVEARQEKFWGIPDAIWSYAELAAKRPYKTFLPDGAQPRLGFYTDLMGKYRGAMERYYINP